MTLDEMYEHALKTESDIQQHLPTLRGLATGKDVLELGVRHGYSTTAFLAGRPRYLLSVDKGWFAFPAALQEAVWCEPIIWETKKADSREPFGEFDITFLDTLHNASHVREELATHAPRTRDRILIHDSVTNGVNGDDGGPGIMVAVEELLAKKEWYVEEHHQNCNGLLVLRRVS